MLADQVRGTSAHRLAVERAKDPADQAGLERRPHGRSSSSTRSAGRGRCCARGSRRPPARTTAPRYRRQVAVGAAHPRNGSRSTGASICTTWFSACTPASVRPAHSVLTGCRRTRSTQLRAGPAPCGRRAGSASPGRHCRGRRRRARGAGAGPGLAAGTVRQARRAGFARALSAARWPWPGPLRAGRARHPCRRSGGTPRPVRACAPAGRSVRSAAHAVVDVGGRGCVVERRLAALLARRAEVERDRAEVERRRRRVRGRMRRRWHLQVGQAAAAEIVLARHRREVDRLRVFERRGGGAVAKARSRSRSSCSLPGPTCRRPRRWRTSSPAAAPTAASCWRQAPRPTAVGTTRGAALGRPPGLYSGLSGSICWPSSCALCQSSPSPFANEYNCVASISKPLVSRRLAYTSSSLVRIASRSGLLRIASLRISSACRSRP